MAKEGHMQSRRQHGFTLVELMITLGIVAILATVAYPSYISQIQKGSRAAAKAQILEIANREQQFLLANRSYADKTALVASGYVLPEEVSTKYDYDIAVGADTIPSYKITFTAKGAQLDDGDLTLDSAGIKTPTDKW